jgi:hypothetical protein
MTDFSILSSRIRENQAKTLRLVLTPELSAEAVHEWTRALEVNQSLTSVQVVCRGLFSLQTKGQFSKSLFKTLLGLPRLQHFQLRGDVDREECILPVSLFADLPIASNELKSVTLSRLVLRGQGPRDFQNLSEWIIKAQSSLQAFRMISVGLQDDTTEGEREVTTAALTPLLAALASFPRLLNLEISGTCTPLGVLEDSPSALFQSKSLRRLSISDFIFSSDALSSVFSDLKNDNQCLEELAISGDLTATVAPQLRRLLETNQTLTALALRLDNLSDEQCNRELIHAIGRSHLKVVSLCSFYGGPLSSASRMAFCQMLRNNVKLEYLYVPCPYSDTAFWDRVKLYLGLNCLGRKHLLKGTKQQCPEEQEEKKDDCATSAPSLAEDRRSLVRSEIDRAFQIIPADLGPRIMKRAPSAPDAVSSFFTPTKKCPSMNDTFTLRSFVKMPSRSSSCKRHGQRVHKARMSTKHKLRSSLSDLIAVVPHEGLSSMFITRPACSS